jgi:hypothetical protein
LYVHIVVFDALALGLPPAELFALLHHYCLAALGVLLYVGVNARVHVRW